ncbi:DUF1993 domain-containing protein [Phyllobacterium sp. SB3]|uniref:DUF1993 domain-containing protein n=1 Tax=Phyllobacterium sp. SB3 TaxID=3156073 RepID=UPI0032AFBABD
MTITMYQASVPVFQRLLANCISILKKAEAHAHLSGTDARRMTEAKLAPDMFPLKVQVQILADGARGCVARLAGQELPAPDARQFAVFNRGYHQDFAESHHTFASLIAYLRDAIDYVDAISPANVDGSENKPIEVTWRDNTRYFHGLPFLRDYALPNFYFHLTISYAILRIAGVPLGKQDFEGTPIYSTGPATPHQTWQH